MEKKYYLGLDVGGTNLCAAVVDSDCRIISRVSIPSGAGRSIEDITDDFAKVSLMAVSESGLELSQIESWGIGMPSCVNKKTNLLVHANCFGWKNVPIYDYLKDKLPLPVVIENDANCAALGEAKAGAAKGVANVLMLTLGTGVGGGIILDGHIYAGADSMGAELGHTKLIYDGELCTCGQKGCLEAYCSSTALIRDARRSLESGETTLMSDMCGDNPDKVDAKLVFDAYVQGDAVAANLIDRYVRHLAAGISSFITIFRPELIVIGGGVANAGDLLFEPLRKHLKECTFGAEEIGVPEVVPAKLGNDAGLIGAAFLMS